MPRDLFAEKGVSPGRDLFAERGVRLPKKDEPGFFSRVGERISESGKETAKIIKNIPNQNPLTSALEIGSQGANVATAPFAEAISTAAKGASNFVTPEGKKAAASALRYVLDSDLARYLSDSAVGDVVRQYSQKPPEALRAAGAALNIGSTLFGGKGATSFASPAVEDAAKFAKKEIKKSAPAIESFGQKQIANAEIAQRLQKDREMFDLILPKQTPTQAEKIGKKSIESGINRVRTPIPSEFDRKTMRYAEEAGASASYSNLKNYNTIRGSFVAEAERLKSSLADLDKANPSPLIPKQKIQESLSPIISFVAENPLLGKEGAKVSKSVVDDFSKIIPKDGASASDLLEFRKKFDKKIERYKGQGVFDPTKETAFTDSVRFVRQKVNDLIAEKYPDAGVKESLERQFHMQIAADNIATKIPKEAPTLIGRLAQKAGRALPHSDLAKIAALVGVGAAPFTTLPVLAGGGALYGAYRGATSPQLRKILGQVIAASARAAK